MTADNKADDANCPAQCGHLVRLFGVAICSRFDKSLKQDKRRALRCSQCMDYGFDTECEGSET